MSSWAEKPVLWAIAAVSAFFRSIGGRACRFEPSCSAYASEAFRRFGFFKALGLTLWRIARCHPFSRGGHDALPK